MRAGAIVLLVLVGCGAAPRPAPSPPPPEPAPPVAEAPAEPPPAPSGPPLSEVEARLILTSALRAEGYRIRHDVRVEVPGAYAVTLDGYDPDAAVGFEYIAPEERDTDLTGGEAAALAADPDRRVLVLDGVDEPTLRAALAEFLATLPPR